jgi:N-acetylmuramic acid 6-phosphate (MurNAc-6-P) etherase
MPTAFVMLKTGNSAGAARARLKATQGNVRKAIGVRMTNRAKGLRNRGK